MSRRLHKSLAALGGAAALAGAPAAHAATVAPGATCVGGLATGFKFPVAATGFQPGRLVTVAAANQIVASGTADAAGNFIATGAVPIISGHRQTVALTATDGLTSAVPTTVTVTRFGVTVPARARPARRVRYRAFGFVPGRRIYLFVRRDGRTLGRFTLGKAKGACGDATRRMRYMPLRHYTTGTYHYWFAQSRRYSKQTRLFEFKITIVRVFR